MAWCHHVVCSEITDRPLWNIKLDRHLVPTGNVFVVQFADDVRDVYAKKLPTKFQRKAIVDDFCRAGKNTPSLALCYILPTGWDDIDGTQFY